MPWLEYYNLLVYYKGEISKASPKEMIAAARANPESPAQAYAIAMRRYMETHKIQIKERSKTTV